MENLQEYIANPFDLGRHEADTLEALREKYPYFQALHILIAKCHKNQNTFGYNKNLKLASLYAGDRKVLFNYINSEPIKEEVEEKINEIVKPVEEVIEEPISFLEQENDTIEENEIETVSSEETVPAPVIKIPKFVWDEELQAYKRVKESNEPTEVPLEKKPIFEVVKKQEVPPVKEIIEPEKEEIFTDKIPVFEEEEIIKISETLVPEIDSSENESENEQIAIQSIEEVEEPVIEIPGVAEIVDEIPEIEIAAESTEEIESNEPAEITSLEIIPDEIAVEPIQESTSEIQDEFEPIEEIDVVNEIEIEENNSIEEVEEAETSDLAEALSNEEPEEELMEINETVEIEPGVETSESETNEQDFYSWLDNFALEETKTLSETEQKSEVSVELKDEITSVDDSFTHQLIDFEEKGIEPIEESTSPVLPLNFEEINDVQEAEYDPAAWAEIAYEIQAFVKTPDVPEEKEFKVKKVSKDEIDDLLDKFIQHNPRISRPKAEFYKPDNMARKSEEFHADVVSETLAKLFYKQGLLHKSLEIYEKLMLQNPDKKDIFAARIKSIKDELINRL